MTLTGSLAPRGSCLPDEDIVISGGTRFPSALQIIVFGFAIIVTLFYVIFAFRSSSSIPISKSEFGAQRFAELTDFPAGAATVNNDMRALIKIEICNPWLEGAKRGKDGVMLLIGSTDRVPLSQTGRQRYESNVGLARARAENVRGEIVGCGVPSAKLISLVTGPEDTSPLGQRTKASIGRGQDRRVDVWALWGGAGN